MAASFPADGVPGAVSIHSSAHAAIIVLCNELASDQPQYVHHQESDALTCMCFCVSSSDGQEASALFKVLRGHENIVYSLAHVHVSEDVTRPPSQVGHEAAPETRTHPKPGLVPHTLQVSMSSCIRAGSDRYIGRYVLL